jgi:uncharacterized protein (TIGR03435 family)
MFRFSARFLASSRRLTLTAIASGAFTGAVAFGFAKLPFASGQLLHANGPLPSFEVASIRALRNPDPEHASWSWSNDRFSTKSFPLALVVEFAYKIRLGMDSRVVGLPGWIDKNRYDIDARVSDADFQKLNNLPVDQAEDQIRLMLQSVLADRCRLKVSYQVKMLPIYALVVAKGGAKIRPEPQAISTWNASIGNGSFHGKDATLQYFAEALSDTPELGDRIVLDETGLKGSYTWDLTWAPEELSSASSSGSPPGPSLFTALQEQLGLKLVPEKGPVEVLVIDHMEPPSAN